MADDPLFTKIRDKKKLCECRVLVVVSQQNLKRQIIDALGVAGIGNVDIAVDAAAASLYLRYQGAVDCIIAETVDDENFLQAARYARWDKGSRDLSVPIIAIGSNWTRGRLAEAKALGVNDLINCPIPLHVLARRIAGVLQDQRRFVVTSSYRGPDRRRTRRDIFTGPFRRSSDRTVLKASVVASPVTAPPSSVIDPMATSQAALARALAKKRV
jgi:PleD family two-component response regulator